MSDEWGPWIEHDGKGCPCKGMRVEVRKRCGALKSGTIRSKAVMPEGPDSAWIWDEARPAWLRLTEVVAYRVSRPKALQQLIERARELDDAPEGPVRTPQHEPTGETTCA